MVSKAGDRITVLIPSNGRYPAEIRQGTVKIVQVETGRIFWYCDTKINRCGVCGPRPGDGHHRLGMHGSYEVN